MELIKLLRAEDLFDGLNPEDRQELDREFEVKPNSDLEYLLKDFEKCINHRWRDYKILKEVFNKECKFHAKDIETFSMMLSSYENYPSFHDILDSYLNKCIQNCIEDKVTIHTNYLSHKLFLNRASPLIDEYNSMRKHIIIKGNAGDHVGENMKGGEIHVYGNAGSDVGSFMSGGKIYIYGNAGSDVGGGMQGGELIIDGNAGDHVGSGMDGGEIIINGNASYVGSYMRKGKIVVYGNARGDIGWNMKGGEIHLNGDYGSISQLPKPISLIYTLIPFLKGGKIYHKGKLIVKNGRKII